VDTTAPHENQPAGSTWSRLITHASEPRFLAGASVFRIVAGLTFVYQLLSVYAQRRYLFGPGGVYPFELFLQDVRGASFSLYSWSDSLLFFEVVYHASIAVAFLWLFGWRTRVLTPLLWALIWSVRERNPLLWDGGDNVMQLALIYACLVDVSARFSFDAIRRARDPRPMSAAAAMAHNAGVLACAIQISLVYGVAGLMKVQGETWRNGTALYYALRGGEFTWPGYSELIFENSALLAALAYATVAFQVSFTFLLFLGRRLRVLAVLAGLSFHLGIMSMMALVSFGSFMMAVDLMFVTDGEYAAVGRALRRLRSGAVGLVRRAARIGRAVPAAEMPRSPLHFARALVHRRRAP
jgi:hypothetical protein